MKRFARRQFLGALAGSMALLPFKKLFGIAQQPAKPGSGGKPLKAVIVYYSATGSTAKVAKAIHRGMKESIDCDLLKIKKANPRKLAQYDLIGLGSPIWYFREPANVKLFVEKMPEMEGKPAFLFCAHGSEPIGFFDSLGRSMMKKKLTIIGWNDWFGSVYHVLHMPKPYLTDGHPDAKDIADAESFGREMADRARRYLAGETGVVPEIPQGTEIDALWIRHDLPEAQHGPGPKTGSGYGDGVDPSVAAVPAIALAGGAQLQRVVMKSGLPTGASSNMKPAPMAAIGATGVRPDGPGNHAGGPGGPSGPGGPDDGPPGGFDPRSAPRVYPKIDLEKCVYPRCDACVFACPVNAIDLSLATPGGAAGPRLAIKEACIGCDLCERVCEYDAMVFEAVMLPKTDHKYDMNKCTYPECTLCVDHCPMNCIDFATRPPTIHSNCEGCDVCWCVCPHDAISITNLAKNHMLLRMSSPNHMFVRALERYETAGRFRRLVPMNQIGFDHPIFMNKNSPRIVLNEDDEATYCDTTCKVDKFHA